MENSEFKPSKKFQSAKDAPPISSEQATEYAKRAECLLDTLGAVEYIILVGYDKQDGEVSGQIIAAQSSKPFFLQAASHLSKKAMSIMLESGMVPPSILDSLSGDKPESKDKKNPL